MIQTSSNNLILFFSDLPAYLDNQGATHQGRWSGPADQDHTQGADYLPLVFVVLIIGDLIYTIIISCIMYHSEEWYNRGTNM